LEELSFANKCYLVARKTNIIKNVTIQIRLIVKKELSLENTLDIIMFDETSRNVYVTVLAIFWINIRKNNYFYLFLNEI
jgi:hypothetical protein